MPQRQEQLIFATNLAKEAGEIMLKYFNSPILKVKHKEDNTPVTIADKKINQLIIDNVIKKYPEHAVNGEEQSTKNTAEYTWVCDPIDGTIPFIKQIPIATFSLALTRNGSPILGVMYDPFHNKMYTARKGFGAYCNDEKIMVSKKPLNISVINIESWQGGIRDVIPPLHKFATQTQMYHIHFPSVVYASMLVASGKIEAEVFPGGRGKNVDIAAAKIIIEEAGGKVTDLDGNEQRYDQDINGAIVSNGIVHNQIVKLLTQK
jgi:fructose-1,6-bisphosphatase/inositol monophosphatase family enzyme